MLHAHLPFGARPEIANVNMAGIKIVLFTMHFFAQKQIKHRFYVAKCYQFNNLRYSATFWSLFENNRTYISEMTKD